VLRVRIVTACPDLSLFAECPAEVPDPRRFRVRHLADVEHVRRQARQLAIAQGLSPAHAEAVELAVSELGTNLVRYAVGGELLLAECEGPRGAGVRVESRDAGPGIEDLEQALEDGYSTGGGLGSGLPAVRRLMDEFSISSGPAGTTVVALKWIA
jgi:serine/threonine-protein kinase RsbT